MEGFGLLAGVKKIQGNFRLEGGGVMGKGGRPFRVQSTLQCTTVGRALYIYSAL